MAVVLDALAPYVKKMVTDMAKEEVRLLLGVSREINKLKNHLGYLQDYVADAEKRRITDASVQSWVKMLKDAMYKAADILELCQLEAMERQEESSGGCLSSLLEGLPMGKSLHDIIHPFLFCLQNPCFAHDAGSRIKKLNQELQGIREGVTKFKFVKLGSYEEQGRRPADTAQYSRRKTTSGFDESAIVGDKIQKDTEKLVRKLISSGRGRGHGDAAAAADVKVVSIVGPGGMGKSTLARKVLASEAIKEEFKTKIWLSVTQQFDKVDLLRSAVTHAKKEPAKGKDESFLEQTLTDALSANKFLLVLDDVWSERVWKEVFQVPVANAARKQPGSRVLLTTRNGDVLLKMGYYYHSHSDQLHVSKLDDEDAWSLLKKQLPQRRQGDFDELKHIGMKIIKKCDGLPLAIKVMGGLLSTRRPNKRDWEIVLEKNIEWKMVDPQEEEELNYSIRLSYEDLSPQLKQCFLYYSLFPKGSGFIEDRVISMWISEGFIQHDGTSESGQLDLEEIGKEYHRELVTRNLLEPDNSTDNIWDYTMHDIVRSFAQFVAREEAFVVHEDPTDIRSLLPENQKFRRLSIEIDSELEWTTLEIQEKLRTLLVIDCNIKPGGSLANFTSLRVLDISSEESDWLVDSLCQLRHLRYLSFSKTNISRLPSDIDKMWFLQHIQLDNCPKLDKFPDSITKLVRLRYLSFVGSKIDIIPRGFGGLTNLRSLYGFPTKMDGDWCTLEELEALSHLRNLQVENLENVHDSSIAKNARISNKRRLEYLKLNCYKEEEDEDEEEVAAAEGKEEEEDAAAAADDDDDKDGEEEIENEEYDEEEEEDSDNEDEKNELENEEEMQIEEEVEKGVQQIGPEQQQRIEDVFDELCPPPILDVLIISRYYGRRLPNWMHSPAATNFESLRSINLYNITYCTQLPDGLCRIPGLEILIISHATAIEHVGADFQSLARGNGGIVTIPFPELTNLLLQGLSEWMEWDWEEQSRVIAMPALENLELIDCKLTHLPPGLASDHRHHLRNISLQNLTLLEYLENFPSLVKLSLYNCPELKRISGLSKLRTVDIYDCPKLKVLEGVLELDSMVLDDESWEITGTPARCTPKAGPLRQLPQDLTITR